MIKKVKIQKVIKVKRKAVRVQNPEGSGLPDLVAPPNPSLSPEKPIVPVLNPEQRASMRAVIIRKIPEQLLAVIDDASDALYMVVLSRLMDETLPEGSTILQVLVAERAAYYWAMGHGLERGTGKLVTEEYKFYVYEFNRNLEILRSLALRNLPAQQVRLLAKKTINVVERCIKDPTAKSTVIKELVQEFSIEVPVAGFKNMGVDLSSLAQS